MAASHPDLPTSTNVSSPIQAATRRRVKQKSNAQPEPQLHRNVYCRDDFVVSDDEVGSFDETEDDSEDGFAPIREKGQSQNKPKRPLGPPITIDEKLKRLNPIHGIVVDGFLQNAKELSQKVSSPRHHHQPRQGTKDC